MARKTNQTSTSDSTSEGSKSAGPIFPPFAFTRERVDAAVCPAGHRQALYRDTEQPALMLRVTASGAKSFVFEKRLGGKTLRITIGPANMQIRSARDKRGRIEVPGADTEAARLAHLVAQGIDPRAEKADKIAAQQADRDRAQAERERDRVEQQRREVTGLEAWTAYCEDRQPQWGERYHADHLAMAAEGGQQHKRSKSPKTTQPGALHALLSRALSSIDAAAVDEWVSRETKTRPRTVSFGFGMLRAFLRWCGEHPDYGAIVVADACDGKRVVEKLGARKAKRDALEKEQLSAWFKEVGKLPPIPSAYLQFVLLVGCRPGEAAALRWEDVDLRWSSMQLRDKVEGDRIVPITPYVHSLLAERKKLNDKPPAVPRRIKRNAEAAEEFLRKWKPSTWVFPATRAGDGHITKANKAHERALKAAGLPHVSQHGLRRSFGSLSEWVECPVGVVAQLQGHRPSATAERHYRVRPLDLLRMWATRIEGWVLTEAGIEQPKAQEPGARPALVVVPNTAA